MASEKETTTPPRKRAAKKTAPAAAPEQPEIEPGDDDAIPPADLAEMGIALPDEGYWTDERLAELRADVATERGSAGDTPPPLSAPAVQTGPDADRALVDFTRNAVAETEAQPAPGGILHRPENVPGTPQYNCGVDANVICVEVTVRMGWEVAGAGDGLKVHKRVIADGVLYSALPPGVRGRTIRGLIERAGREALAEVPTGGRKRNA